MYTGFVGKVKAATEPVIVDDRRYAMIAQVGGVLHCPTKERVAGKVKPAQRRGRLGLGKSHLRQVGLQQTRL